MIASTEMKARVREKLAKHHLEDKTNTCIEWLARHDSESVDAYVRYYRENCFYVKGQRFDSLMEALGFAGFTSMSDYQFCLRTIQKYYSDKPNEGLQYWLGKRTGESSKRTLLEKRVDLAVQDELFIYEEEKSIEALVEERRVNYEKLLENVRQRLGKLMYIVSKLDMNIDSNVSLYRYDTYVKPCKALPNGAFIEADGSQHFKLESKDLGEKNVYTQTIEEFTRYIIRDKIKNIVAEYLGIPILRISYFQTGCDIDMAVARIKDLLRNFVENGKSVPADEYYAPLYRELKAARFHSSFITAFKAG